jgi:prepilin-type N-terminal cleavage/methylation domain-containing protein
MKRKKEGGFTLLELLIVIAIIAILSVALVLVLNPAETLKKARDGQRISDLSTMKTAIGLYMTSVATPLMGGASSATVCQAAAGTWASGNKIFYSLPNTSLITDTTLDNGTTFPVSSQVVTPGLTNGTGWIPVDFSQIAGGSPISNVPVDPINALGGVDTLASITSSSLFYRYACSQSPIAFEIDAQLESTAYTVTDDKRASDGGNSPVFYETGTNLLILGPGNVVGKEF